MMRKGSSRRIEYRAGSSSNQRKVVFAPNRP